MQAFAVDHIGVNVNAVIIAIGIDCVDDRGADVDVIVTAIGHFRAFQQILLVVQSRFKHTVNYFAGLYSKIIFGVGHLELVHGLCEQFGSMAGLID